MTLRSSAVGSRSARAATVAAVASVLSLVAVVPHIVDDATGGGLGAFGLTTGAAAWLVGGALALQTVSALAALRERRAGFAGILLLATGWVVAALADHWEAFVPGAAFGGDLPARAAVWGLVVLQAVAAVAALSALRWSRQTSFKGTGSFG